ncbi:hypothetical protein [Spartinivicinus poritis]|uniref:hypothetical protein n=1 Tax=Spartinivicinus poritis TaxID=2994640 RepID=UPI003CC920D2
MSKLILQAVNDILLSIRESPVAYLNSFLLKTTIASDLLDQQCESVQAISFSFNTKKCPFI